MPAFACGTCQSRSFTLDGNFTEATIARCSQCGATLGAWAQLRRELEQRLRAEEERVPAGPDGPPRRETGAFTTSR
jgi:hypothetical protein